MQKVVGIRFKKKGKVYYFSPENIKLALGDAVIVETVRGIEFGIVVLNEREIAEDEIVLPVKPVLRKANQKDLAMNNKNKDLEKEALAIANEKIKAHALMMKLLSVDVTFDMSKIIFYFTAEGRIDFRELVRDLASVFRTRIELRQVGVRDEAKEIGGIGCCGREFCCASFLGEFVPVSIRMAKEQNISLKATKISGACGRLMCCLKYESNLNEDVVYKKNAVIVPPTIGSKVISEEGEGEVVSVNMARRLVGIKLENGNIVNCSWEDIVAKEELEEIL